MISTAEIRSRVREMFNRVADAPADRYRFAVGADLATRLGYPADVLASLPPAASERFTGVAYLHDLLELGRAPRVLDLGSGGGLDAVLLGRAVAPHGFVLGVDGAERMVAKATALARELRLHHVAFVHAQAEAMPFPAATFDVVHINGFLNLCPDKRAVAHELARIVRRHAYAMLAEITFAPGMPVPEMRTVDDWFR